MFAHYEPKRKHKVRYAGNDRGAAFSQNANVSKRATKQMQNEQYAALREASGWHLRAWRHYRNLTADELAAEVGSSKSVISELETGAPKGDKPPARFNRDHLDRYAKALGTTAGFLLDVNPFAADAEFMAMVEAIRDLSDQNRKTVANLVQHLKTANG